MPAKLGEYCSRCGAKTVPTNDGENLIYNCPNKHGEQRREPIEKPAAENSEQES